MKNFRSELLSKWILHNIYNQSLNIIECWLDTKWKLDFSQGHLVCGALRQLIFHQMKRLQNFAQFSIFPQTL